MARVTTTYKAGLAELVGTSSEKYEASSVRELLKQIKARHGKAAYKSAHSMLITVNMLSIQKEHHFSTRLSDGDVVGFFPLAAGG